MSAPLARNWPYIWQQMNALLHNTSPVITLICVADEQRPNHPEMN